MAIFKKKTEEDKEKDRDLKSGDGKGKRTFRKRKKDVLPRQWTKKERILVLVIFGGTILISGILAMSAREWKLPNFPRISLPSFSLFKDEVINLGGGSVSNTDREKANNVIENFKNITSELSGVYGLYVQDLGRKFAYGVNQDETFQAASLIKLPVMAAAYIESENGNIDLDEVYSLKDSDKVSGSGNLSTKPEGTKKTYRELLELMGKQSDNTAYKIILNEVGEEKVKQVIQDIGMENTSFDENETTPSDIGFFFQKLFSGLLSKKNKDELLGFLTDTSYEEWLVAGIPNSIRASHKYGREVHVVNDAGIVFSDDPFIVVILSKGVVEREADEIFPELSSVVYEGQID